MLRDKSRMATSRDAKKTIGFHGPDVYCEEFDLTFLQHIGMIQLFLPGSKNGESTECL